MRSPCLIAVAVLIQAASAQMRAPAIVAEGNEVTIQGSDLVLEDNAPRDAAAPVSLRGLVAEVSTLRSQMVDMETEMADMVTRDEVQIQVDAVVDGIMADIRAEIRAAVDPLAVRVAGNEVGLAGLPQTVRTVATIAADVEYLRAHSANVTTCAANGEVHAGDGSCIDPVPQCSAPEAPTGGSVSLSADFIIPGVTARYACSGDRAFVAGPTIRTCVEDTLAFDGSAPRCLNCAVPNCQRCVNTTSLCAVCAYGHDLSDDQTSCDERAMSIVWLGGQFGRHNFHQSQVLEPNSNSFRYFLPYAGGGTGGAAAIIQGTTYLYTRSFRCLRNGATTWSACSVVNAPGSASFPFYATINGEGTTEDGFYIFGTNAAAVFRPTVDDTQWTRFATLTGDQQPRQKGATAVIGKLIYCIGGLTASGARSDRIDIFNTTTRTWATGPSLPAVRWGHSAAAYGGKIYVFGGRVGGNNLVSDSVQELNPATGQWVDKAPMPEAWEGMSTGPMPTYANGEVIIPHAYKANSGVSTALKYDIRADAWEAGPSVAARNGRYAVAFGSLN